MLARLGEIAKKRGLDYVDVTFVDSGKNRPALDFLESVGANFKKVTAEGYSFRFPGGFAAAVEYHPGATEPASSPSSSDEQPAPSRVKDGGRVQPKSALLSRIAGELSSAEKILKVIESQKQRARPKLAEAYVAPRTPIEETLAGIWTQTLGINKVGINDNFFLMGGHSLLGTLLVSRVCDAFQTNLSLRHLFESPTVAGLSQIIKQGQIEQASAQEIAAALSELDELSDEDVMALLANEDDVRTDQEKDSAVY